MGHVIVDGSLALGVLLPEVGADLLHGGFVLQIVLWLICVFPIRFFVLLPLAGLVGPDLIRVKGFHVIMLKANGIAVVHELLVLLHRWHAVAAIILVVLIGN